MFRGDTFQASDVSDCGVGHTLADAADGFGRRDASFPLLTLQKRADLLQGSFLLREGEESGEGRRGGLSARVSPVKGRRVGTTETERERHTEI